MLKRLAIVTVFVAVTQALVPASGQASNDPTHAPANIKGYGQSQQHPAAPPLPAINANKPPSADGNGGENGKDDAEHSVTITKFPPVSINRDWIDWGVWIFSGLLAVVGFLQVGLLWRTLGAIKKQATTMKTQAGLMLDQVKLMKLQGDMLKQSVEAANAQIQMTKAKEQCELTLEPLPLTPFLPDIPWQDVGFVIENIGPTRASQIRVVWHYDVTRSASEPGDGDSSVLEEGIAEVIVNQLGVGQIDVSTVPVIRADGKEEVAVRILWELTAESAQKVRNVFIHVWGRMEYRNIFEEQRWMTFHYDFHIVRFNIFGDKLGRTALEPISVARWTKCGLPEHNERDKPPNPN
jgi:hypothetical protein